MLVPNKEAGLFGTVLIASGSSQVVCSWIFSESIWLVFGLACVSFGIAIVALGFLRTNRKPSGIIILGLSYGFSGLLAIRGGVWLSAPLFLLAAMCFSLSWGLIKRKTWARPASLLTTALVLSASIITGTISTLFPAAEIFPLVPSTLVSIYLLWYLTRPHVTRFFDPEDSTEKRLHYTGEERNYRGLIAMTVCFLLLASFLAYSYSYPLSGLPVAAEVDARGIQGAGELGTPARGRELQFWASRGDLLNYSFRCTDAEPAHVWVTHDLNENKSVTIVEKIGLEGSWSTWAPQTSNYTMWIANQRPRQTIVLCEIWVTSFSLRRPIIQSLLLSLFGAAVSISLMLTPTKKPPT